MMKIFLLMGLVTFLYYITPLVYGKTSEPHKSYLIVLLVQTIPVMLSACIVAVKQKAQYKMKVLIPWLGLVFSIVALYSAMFPTEQTSAGLATTESLNYQNISYMAAFAASFCAYYIVSFSQIKWDRLFRINFMRWIMLALVFVNLITIFISGGRGGIVAFLSTMLFLFYAKTRNAKSKKGTKMLYLVIGVGLILIGYEAIQVAGSLNLDASGYERVAGFVDGSDEGPSRIVLWEMYISSILASPIWGHGFGSVFFESDFYSHNLFVDAMVETGLIGAFILLGLVIRSFKEGFMLMKSDVSECLWVLIFLEGFVWSFFSGYYLSHLLLWWGIVFIHQKKLPKKMYNSIVLERK